MIKSLKEKVRHRLLMDYQQLLSRDEIDTQELSEVVFKVIDEVSKRQAISLSEDEKKSALHEIIDEFLGLGPIEGLMMDPDITEIMINGPKKVYIEKFGKTIASDVVFEDERELMHIVHKILSPTRRRVDESYPFTDVSMKDGSRVNIVIYPVSIDGPAITIRKFLKEIRKVDDLIRLNTLDQRMADFLVACIKAKINIMFSGATGSGKTTTVNVLSDYVSNDERIVTIEDTAELHLSQDHVVRLEARQPNIEGKGEITIRGLFKNTLRMRPDRIILGEIRSAEALDMLQAMCSGHTGSLAVIHANSPQDVMYRLETMILTSGIPINLDAIHRQISGGLHLIVQQEQLADGSRKITYITQVNGMKDGQVVLEDLFRYEIESVDPSKVKGRWISTGYKPAFYNLFKKAGVALPEAIFNKD